MLSAGVVFHDVVTGDDVCCVVFHDVVTGDAVCWCCVSSCGDR